MYLDNDEDSGDEEATSSAAGVQSEPTLQQNSPHQRSPGMQVRNLSTYFTPGH